VNIKNVSLLFYFCLGRTCDSIFLHYSVTCSCRWRCW